MTTLRSHAEVENVQMYTLRPVQVPDTLVGALAGTPVNLLAGLRRTSLVRALGRGVLDQHGRGGRRAGSTRRPQPFQR